MRKVLLFGFVAGWVVLGGLGTGAAPAHAAPSVPLPSTLPLLGLGLAALSASRRRHK